jgi:hypothetical protein
MNRVVHYRTPTSTYSLNRADCGAIAWSGHLTCISSGVTCKRCLRQLEKRRESSAWTCVDCGYMGPTPLHKRPKAGE